MVPLAPTAPPGGQGAVAPPTGESRHYSDHRKTPSGGRKEDIRSCEVPGQFIERRYRSTSHAPSWKNIQRIQSSFLSGITNFIP